MLRFKRCEKCGEPLDNDVASNYCYRHRQEFICEECGQESDFKLRVRGRSRVCEDCYDCSDED